MKATEFRVGRGKDNSEKSWGWQEKLDDPLWHQDDDQTFAGRRGPSTPKRVSRGSWGRRGRSSVKGGSRKLWCGLGLMASKWGRALLSQAWHHQEQGGVSGHHEGLSVFLYGKGFTHLLQDSAPSSRTIAFLADQGIDVSKWAGQLPWSEPHLEPLAWVREPVGREEMRCIIVAMMKKEIKRIWCLDITRAICKTLVKSMTKRFQAVL